MPVINFYFSTFTFFLSIINWLEQHQLPCIIKKLTGVDCPGCGFQRSAIALMKGNVLESFRLYPALMPIILFFAFLVVKKRTPLKNSTNSIKIGLCIIFITILVSYIFKLTT